MNKRRCCCSYFQSIVMNYGMRQYLQAEKAEIWVISELVVGWSYEQICTTSANMRTSVIDTRIAAHEGTRSSKNIGRDYRRNIKENQENDNVNRISYHQENDVVLQTSIASPLAIRSVQSKRCCLFTTGRILAAKRNTTSDFWFKHTQIQTRYPHPFQCERVQAWARSLGRPDLLRTSRSTRSRDMRPRVRPAVKPANTTNPTQANMFNMNFGPQHGMSGFVSLILISTLDFPGKFCYGGVIQAQKMHGLPEFNEDLNKAFCILHHSCYSRADDVFLFP